LHPFCLIDSVGRFDRHDASTTENSAGPRRSNFNDVTRAFVTKRSLMAQFVGRHGINNAGP
jgi:hypothetical protein